MFIRLYFKVALLCILAIGALLCLPREHIKNILSYSLYYENWQLLKGQTVKYDYSWLDSTDNQIFIAHALGFSNNDMQNTYDAYRISRLNGFRYFEVDLWLDRTNTLRCHHGPGEPDPLTLNSCQFPELARRVCADRNYLILDIKTDFYITVEHIARKLESLDTSCIIFQLYHPEDFEIFDAIQRKYNLIGPIFTYYLSRRNVAQVINTVRNYGIKAVTIPNYVPIKRSDIAYNVRIFTHPVASCSDFYKAKKIGAVGFYITNDFFTKKKYCIE